MDRPQPPAWLPSRLAFAWPLLLSLREPAIEFRNKLITILILSVVGLYGIDSIASKQQQQTEQIELQNERLLEQNRLQAAELSLRHAEHEYWQIPVPAAAVSVTLKQP
jgi:hypothetical protein